MARPELYGACRRRRLRPAALTLLVLLLGWMPPAGLGATALPADIRIALASRDFETAVAWLEANQADPAAAYELGKLYRLGQGVKKDPDRAIELFATAAGSGNAEAAYLLGKHHERAGASEQADAWMRTAADLNHDRARAWLEAAPARSPAQNRSDLSLHDALSIGAPPPLKAGTDLVEERDAFGRTPLMEAIERNSPAWVDFLIGAGVRLDESDPLGNTALHFAILKGNRSLTSRLLDAGANPNVETQEGSTPLHVAIAAEDLDIVRLLLQHNASRTIRNSAGWTPETLATRSDNAQLRAAFGVAVTVDNRRLARLDDAGNADDLLAGAARKGDLQLITQLLDRGVAVDQPDASGARPIVNAVRNGQSAATRLLLEHGAQCNARDEQPLLQLAAVSNQPDTMAELIRAGCDPDTVDSAGSTALMVAIQAGCQPCTAQLFAAGAAADIRDQRGQTALLIALRQEDSASALRLIAKSSALDNVDQSGRNALWWAAQTGQRDAVAALLARGSLPLADQDAVGPLHVAAQGNHREIVEQLVPLTDTNARSKTGNTPLLSAAHSGAADALTALIETGADLEARNDRGDTALIAAVRSGDIRSTQLLLAAGANPNVRNQRFESASSLIKQRNEPEWLELLESKWLRFGIGYRLIDGTGYASRTNA